MGGGVALLQLCLGAALMFHRPEWFRVSEPILKPDPAPDLQPSWTSSSGSACVVKPRDSFILRPRLTGDSCPG